MTALIILAAGASNRMGQPKQNLLFQNQTLLERAIKTGLGSNCGRVIVVLGANAAAITIHNKEVEIIFNKDWQEGMASSIRIAIEEIEKDQTINGAIIMLCDQPFVTTALLNSLITKQTETGKAIIACSYRDTAGVPALFHRSLFHVLLSIIGNEGAKKIINTYMPQTVIVPFDGGDVDIDTPDDYNRLLGSG